VIKLSKEVLEQLKQYVKTHGIKYRWIADQLNISESYFCNCRSGRRELARNKLSKLQKLIYFNKLNK